MVVEDDEVPLGLGLVTIYMKAARRVTGYACEFQILFQFYTSRPPHKNLFKLAPIFTI